MSVLDRRVGACKNKSHDELGRLSGHRADQRRVASHALQIDVGAGKKQRSDQVCTTAVDGDNESAAPVFSLVVAAMAAVKVMVGGGGDYDGNGGFWWQWRWCWWSRDAQQTQPLVV